MNGGDFPRRISLLSFSFLHFLHSTVEDILDIFDDPKSWINLIFLWARGDVEIGKMHRWGGWIGKISNSDDDISYHTTIHIQFFVGEESFRDFLSISLLCHLHSTLLAYSIEKYSNRCPPSLSLLRRFNSDLHSEFHFCSIHSQEEVLRRREKKFLCNFQSRLSPHLSLIQMWKLHFRSRSYCVRIIPSVSLKFDEKLQCRKFSIIKTWTFRLNLKMLELHSNFCKFYFIFFFLVKLSTLWKFSIHQNQQNI